MTISPLPPIQGAGYVHPGMYMSHDAADRSLAHAETFSIQRTEDVLRNRKVCIIPLDASNELLLSTTPLERESYEKAYEFANEYFQVHGDWEQWNPKTFDSFAQHLNMILSDNQNTSSYRKYGISVVTKKSEAPHILNESKEFLAYLRENDPASVPLFQQFNAQKNSFYWEVETGKSPDPIGNSKILSGPVKAFLKRYIWIFPPGPTVEKRIHGLFQAFQKTLGKDPIESASMIHTGIVRNHPFEDGNGRLGRMLMNITLVKSGLPPLIFPSQQEYDMAAARAIEENPEYFTQFLHERMRIIQEQMQTAATWEDPYRFVELYPLMENIRKLGEDPDVQRGLREGLAQPLEEQPPVLVRVEKKKSCLSLRSVQIALAGGLIAIAAKVHQRYFAS